MTTLIEVNITTQLDVTKLTPRQLDIVNLLLLGLSNKAIAKELMIGTETVKSHLHNVYCKYSISNRSKLITQYYQATLSSQQIEYNNHQPTQRFGGHDLLKIFTESSNAK